MRKLKRFASVLLALVMCFGLTVTAFADTTYTITINNSTEGYTYAAYQVFAGTLTDGKLSGITWGSGVNGDALVTALKAASDEPDNTLEGMFPETSYTAEEVAAVLAGDDFTEAMVKAFAEIVGDNLSSTYTESDTFTTGDTAYTISNLAAGYYLVKNTAVPTGGTYTSYILEVTSASGVTAEPKVSTPTFDKTIDDYNDSDSSEDATPDTTDSADYDAGDEVHYTLTATLPSNYADYETYKMAFHDQMDTDYLEFNSSSVKVFVTDGTDTWEVDDDCYSVSTSGTTYSPSGTQTSTGTTSTFDVTITDTNSLYTDDAKTDKITVTSDCTIYVTYTATLKAAFGSGIAAWNYAYLEYSNNPTYTGSGEAPTDNTPEDEVVVITFKLTVNKKDTSGNPLTGAGFTLYKYDEDYTGTDYTDKYVPVGSEVGGTGTSISEFTWDGLDAGKYKLVETTLPGSDYKQISDIYFTVTATHSENATGTTTLATNFLEVLDSLSVDNTDFSVDSTTYEITTNVVNSTTAELPSTGGIGTTIFYVVGGVLVVGAVVLLITRKRMKDGQ